jgi:hypothetical protein
MVTVKFANGKIYEAGHIDEAIKLCLADGHDPFKPVVIAQQIKQKKIKKIEEYEYREQF